ncbi:MAG: ribonuclease HI [bacterium]
MSPKKKKQYYVVIQGHKPGIYDKWYGPGGAAEQVVGFPEALYKGFYTQEEIHKWLKEPGETSFLLERIPELLDKPACSPLEDSNALIKRREVVIYTDGAAISNPGPGGYGVILLHKGRRKELSGGYRLTTNNRMELRACIVGLKALKFKCSVVIWTDSKYVIHGITKGWARRWRANNWMRGPENKAENPDLWAELLELCEKHDVKFRWVKGHDGNPQNERCDQLANKMARRRDLPADEVYETMKIKKDR